MNCMVCTHQMNGPFRGYWFECTNCGFLASNLAPAIGQQEAHETIDEESRLQALQPLRESNFEQMLDRQARLTPTESLSLLEVGCGHGWFLQAAASRGYRTLGIEPDPVIAAHAKSIGLDVIEGYFPDALSPQARFDLIAFNDVFEHLPDPKSAALASFACLRPGGMLLLTLPSSKGALFRIARTLSALGFSGPLDRMWQRGFPSPHISYFHPQALASFLLGYGFREVYRGSLPSLSRAGLWKRLTYDRQTSRFKAALLFPMLYLLSPIIQLFPADISFQVFRKAAPEDEQEQDVTIDSNSDLPRRGGS